MAENIEMNQATEEADLSEVLQVRRDKLAGLIESGKNPFEITKYDVDADSEGIKSSYVEGEEKKVSIAGRIMSRRIMGKASFFHIKDAFLSLTY